MWRSRNFARVMGLLAIVSAASCSPDDDRRRGDGGMGSPDAMTGDAEAPTSCTPGGPAVICNGTVAQHCNPDGTMESTRNCAEDGLTCARDLGCAECQPGRLSCEGGDSVVCRADGSGFDVNEACDAASGLTCDSGTGACVNLCQEAVSNNSYIGCEYWPVVTSNASLAEEFEFAVVVANPQAVEAQVTIERGGSTTTQTTVAPGGVEAIRLPWVAELKNDAENPQSAVVSGGAYRLASTVPVTVYQFNPLQFRVGRDCASEPATRQGDGQCHSFSNDASLLLPSHVLTGNYMVASRAGFLMHQAQTDFSGNVMNDPMTGEPMESYGHSPGFFAVVAVDESVDVEVRYSAHVAEGNGVSTQTPGSSATYRMSRGDVLQVVTAEPPHSTCDGAPSNEQIVPAFPPAKVVSTYCNVGEDYDLTGTEIRASGKVAVVSGHNCTFVPYDRWACDHLEEAMFPLETWGQQFLLSATEPLRGEPNVVRVVSGRDGNDIAFSPGSVSSNTSLNRGEMVEFEVTQDFQVTGSEALMVVQYLVGQDYDGPGTGGTMGEGDPSMSLAIPVEQYRSSYTFLAPDSFTSSLVNVTANEGQQVMLDGMPIAEGLWRNVGGTGLRTARVRIQGGAHSVESAEGVGIVVYGFGSFTSYMYPGGLDLEMINIPF